jgi:hypothetical protein
MIADVAFIMVYVVDYIFYKHFNMKIAWFGENKQFLKHKCQVFHNY